MRHVLPPAAFALVFLTALAGLTMAVATRLHPGAHPVAQKLPAGAATSSPVAIPSPTLAPRPAASTAPPAQAPLAAAAQAAPPRAHQAPPAPPPTITVDSYQQALINQDRAGSGLTPLTWSGCLAQVAVENARRMAAQGFASHSGGTTADLACGLGPDAGENLGYWTGGIDDAAVNAMFMASPEHRANIMGPFHFVATAWAVAPNGTAFLAVEFA